VLPARLGERAGDDVLLHRVEIVGHPGRVIGLRRPEASEGFEGVAADQQCVGRLAVLGGHVRDVGLVDVPGERVEPASRHVDHPVEGGVLRDHEFAHRSSSGWAGTRM
jgi:hypothetical protein